MHERPVGDLVDALRSIGARIDYAATPGYPPLQIYPGNLDPGRGVRIRGNVSSQFVTALLMALPLIGRECRLDVEGVLISQPYVEMTLKTMELFGVKVDHEGLRTFIVPARQTYRSPGELFVEGDASAASYFLAAGLISGLKGGGPVRVEGVGLNSIQGDVRFTEVLEAMGGFVTSGKNWIEATASSEVMNRGRLRAFDMDLNHIPDAAMTAAVAALFAEGTSTLRNIGSWRVKETDRIAAMAHELRKLGAAVHEGPDYLRITAPERITAHAEIDTYDDHRIAMSFALAALAGVCIRINEPACVAKTFPEYFDVLGSISMVGGPS
jgi:3-phosphoshikimate 1-carboxyvinyltransferase